ncbi:MAG: hypothetical protein HS104_31400 [Polyangiaceae bacterium]|nr:hypothetical protein [Polyangiaceae bacterium]MCL4750738.1 hypothetical protein [Myxococcales bacterium]
MNPYRSAPRPEHIPARPLHPGWKSYRRQTLFYNLLLWACVLFFAGLVIFEPVASIVALPLLPLPPLVVWLGVRDCVCPECGLSIVDGPLVQSYTRYFAGLFPRDCTQCGAEIPDGPVQPECDCTRCVGRG